jgi:hypothetical protein
MANILVSGIQSAFLAAEVLAKQIGQVAAQSSNMPEAMWVEYLADSESNVCHFRFLNPMTIGASTEASALPTGSWSPTGVTISGGMIGQSIQVGAVTNSLSPRVLSEIANDSGQAIGRKIDTDSTALFSSLTGGTVGTSGGALTVTNILTANANLDANHADVIGPYQGRLHPHQFLNLQTDVLSKNYGIAKLNVDASGESISIGGTVIRKNSLVSKGNSNADWFGGIFVYQALGLAITLSPTVKILPVPGYATQAVDAYAAYGVGVVRPTLGCLVQSGVSA